VTELEHHLRRQLEHGRQFFWHRLRWRAVAGYIPTGRPVEILDVGAGAGILGAYLQRERPLATYRFVEPIEELARHLGGRFGVDANALDRTGIGHADFVALLDVLEHQEDDLDFMLDLVGEMKRGSKLLLTVPALQRLWSAWDVSLGHYRRYDKKSMRALLGQLPVAVREMSYLFPEMLAPAISRKLAHPASKPSASGAEFRDLPRVANETFYRLGRSTLALRRIAPLGTSLFVAAERT
jgi:methyltransferase family protein